jgi:hypothetical protein
MPNDPLATYLHDHLAGSTAALQLIDTLAEHERGHPLEAKLGSLRAQIEADQHTLRQIVARVDSSRHRLEQAAAWVSEKVSQAKLTLADRASHALATLEGLEALGLGILGKRALWIALGELAPRDPRLAGFDFEALEASAGAQHDLVEQERLQAAGLAFAGVGAETQR